MQGIAPCAPLSLYVCVCDNGAPAACGKPGTCEQKYEPWMPSLMQVGHCSLASLVQSAVSHTLLSNAAMLHPAGCAHRTASGRGGDEERPGWGEGLQQRLGGALTHTHRPDKWRVTCTDNETHTQHNVLAGRKSPLIGARLGRRGKQGGRVCLEWAWLVAEPCLCWMGDNVLLSVWCR